MRSHSFPKILTFLLVAVGIGTAGAEPLIRPGDRVAIIGNTFADQLRVHGYLETLLVQHFGKGAISVRNLGWGGDMLSARDRPTHFPSEVSSLVAHKTDVIIACFGMGESFGGDEGIDTFRADLKAFFASHRGKSYNGKSEVRLVLVSPISVEDLGDRTPNRARRDRQIESYTSAMREASRDAGISFVDLFEPTRYFMESPDGPPFTTNGIHLNAYGYWTVGHLFFDALISGDRGAPSGRPWRVEIDSDSGEGIGKGVKVSDVKREGTGIRFQVKEEVGPTLAPPTEDKLPLRLEEFRDRLIVRNLSPGRYSFLVDGEAVVTAGDKEWAEGVAIDSSPAHREAEALRDAVNDKNLQFTYSWKALNQVHIVGERKSSPSGKALPGEIIEFNKLANQRDEDLRDRVTLKTREWQLVPVRP